MMIANTNKENVVLHAPQAGKAVPKTPAPGKLNPKTPFKIPLNDENGAAATINPKTGKKLMLTSKNASQFVTPIGPRRPALAGKTTNVKARNLPPSAEQGKTQKKQTSTIRPIRARIETPVTQDNEYPEIEYMPPAPKERPLTLDEEDLGERGTFEFLQNYMVGSHRAYLAGIDESGKSELQRNLEESYRREEELLDAETETMMDDLRALPDPDVKPATAKKTARPKTTPYDVTTIRRAKDVKRPAASVATTRPSSRGAKPTSRPSSRGANTLDTKKAASLLSKRPSSSASNARPEANPRGHTRSVSTTAAVAAAVKRPFSFARQPSVSKPTHHRSRSTIVAAEATSKTSIGYTAGRDIKDVVAKELHTPKETAADVMARIHLQEEEIDNADFGVPILEVEEDDNSDIIVEPIIDEDDDFFIELPEEY